MSIPFKEIQMSTPTKEQILREINRTWKPPKDMRRSYFYDGGARGEQAHYALESEAAYSR